MEQTLYEKRTSVRKYQDKPVPREVVETLLQAAIQAPSGGNRQPWHFFVVTQPARKEKICGCFENMPFIGAAPVVIVVCAEPERSASRYGERGGKFYSVQDTAAAIENLLLCATEQGLGACWCGAFDDEALFRVMELDSSMRPVAVLPVGYPAPSTAQRPRRRPLEQVVTYIE